MTCTAGRTRCQPLGVEGAIAAAEGYPGAGAIASIPSCPGEAMLAGMVRAYAEKLTPMTPVRRTVPGE